MQSISAYTANIDFCNKASWSEWFPMSEKVLEQADRLKNLEVDNTLKLITIIAGVSTMFFVSSRIYLKYLDIQSAKIKLILSAREGNLNSIKSSIQNKQNLDCSYEGITPLAGAILAKQSLAVAQLLENGANTEKKDSSNRTALQLACIIGSTEIVQLLRKYGAKINSNDKHAYTPFFISMISKNYHLIEELLEFPEINQQSLDSILLELICVLKIKEKADYVEKFLAKGANPNIFLGVGLVNGEPILHSALYCTPQFFDNWRIIDLLIKYGADLNAKDNNGDTFLHLCATSLVNPELIDYLIEKGADPKIPDRFGNVPAIKKRSTLSIAATDKKV